MTKKKSTKQKSASSKGTKKTADAKTTAARKVKVEMPDALTSATDANDLEAAAPLGFSALTPIAEAADAEAPMTSSECIDWRLGEFRERVRHAVAQWAREAEVTQTNTLSELAKGTPWNTGQMAQLVQTVNDNRVFEPPFPGRVMQPPTQLVPGSTTVLQWEAIVWKHQSPLTPCFAFTD